MSNRLEELKNLAPQIRALDRLRLMGDCVGGTAPARVGHIARIKKFSCDVIAGTVHDEPVDNAQRARHRIDPAPELDNHRTGRCNV